MNCLQSPCYPRQLREGDARSGHEGDGIDDLVLMTGVSWWFSSGGQYSWSYLKADLATLNSVQFGDFDGAASRKKPLIFRLSAVRRINRGRCDIDVFNVL